MFSTAAFRTAGSFVGVALLAFPAQAAYADDGDADVDTPTTDTAVGDSTASALFECVVDGEVVSLKVKGPKAPDGEEDAGDDAVNSDDSDAIEPLSAFTYDKDNGQGGKPDKANNGNGNGGDKPDKANNGNGNGGDKPDKANNGNGNADKANKTGKQEAQCSRAQRAALKQQIKADGGSWGAEMRRDSLVAVASKLAERFLVDESGSSALYRIVTHILEGLPEDADLSAYLPEGFDLDAYLTAMAERDLADDVVDDDSDDDDSDDDDSDDDDSDDDSSDTDDSESELVVG